MGVRSRIVTPFWKNGGRVAFSSPHLRKTSVRFSKPHISSVYRPILTIDASFYAEFPALSIGAQMTRNGPQAHRLTAFKVATVAKTSKLDISGVLGWIFTVRPPFESNFDALPPPVRRIKDLDTSPRHVTSKPPRNKTIIVTCNYLFISVILRNY